MEIIIMLLVLLGIKELLDIICDAFSGDDSSFLEVYKEEKKNKYK